MPMIPKFPLPECLNGKCSQKDYKHWLDSKAKAHVKRDTNRGNITCTFESYRKAIHEAVANGGDRDAFTGEALRWDLIRKYDNDESLAGRRVYKKTFALLPSVDHLDEGLGEPRFAICAWRTNDCKGDLDLDELAEFCQKYLEHYRSHGGSAWAARFYPTGGAAVGTTPAQSTSRDGASQVSN